MNIGERIKAVAKSRGITQQQIGNALGVTQAFISAIYTGKKTPSLEMLIDLCQYLNVSPNVLLDINSNNESVQLSDEERNVIEKFRALSTRDRAAVTGLIDSLSKPNPKTMFASTLPTGKDEIDTKIIG